jgi:hypothetical protein
MADIPCTPEQLTPEWLTAALRDSGSLTEGQVVSVTHEIIGTGKMGDNARLTLSYDHESSAPATLIAKLPATDETARSMAGAMGAYYNEVMFYTHLAPQTDMRTPTIYANEVNAEGTEFVTLMEDLAPAEPGSQLIGESLEHARMALREASRLAASFYRNEEIKKLDYVTNAAAADGGAQGAELMEQFWPVFVDRFGHGLDATSIEFGELYVPNHRKFATRFDGDKTLVHGDFRCENLLFGSDTATVVDWQTVGVSSALTDAAYFLGGSVEIDQRREWERGLIDEYAGWMQEAGVDLSAAECWEQYREFAMHGIVITVLGACFTEAAERSDRMFLAMIQRHLQQCVDLSSAEFLQ